ncbi:MAG: MauE/DoxX family redox-associated membrane protein [Elusimicrobiota bacterium]
MIPRHPALPWLGIAARMLVGLVLVMSGTYKAAAPPEEFALVIDAYRMIPSADLIQAMAVFLPWLELLVGFALILGYFTRHCAVAAAGMFGVFITAILSIKLRGIDLPNCGCFGFGFHPQPLQTAIMDALLFGAALLAYRHGPDRLSLDNWGGSGYN